MRDYDEATSGHRSSAVNAYNAPAVPERCEPLPAPENAGWGTATLTARGRTYRATYTTDWERGGRTTYQVEKVGAFELSSIVACPACGHDEHGRPRPCRHVSVRYGRGPQYTPQNQRQDLPVINRVPLAGRTSMDPAGPAPAYFIAYRPRGAYDTEQAPDKTTATLRALVHALVRHWDALPEAAELRAAAAHALAARRYHDAVAEAERVRERIAQERVELERAEAMASYGAALAGASSYSEVARLMQEPSAPRREYNVYGVCDGTAEDEPMVVMVTRSFVLSEYDDWEGHAGVVCTDTVSAATDMQAAEMFQADHQFRHGQ